MVDINQLRAALLAAGVKVTPEDMVNYVNTNKIKAKQKTLRASGTVYFLGQPKTLQIDHEGIVCPLHAGRVLANPADPEATPTNPVIPAAQQGFNVDCLACFVAAGNTLDHIFMKGLTA
jgi:hypothetical protein